MKTAQPFRTRHPDHRGRHDGAVVDLPVAEGDVLDVAGRGHQRVVRVLSRSHGKGYCRVQALDEPLPRRTARKLARRKDSMAASMEALAVGIAAALRLADTADQP